MPKRSQFFGIAIYMYYRDHAPPHFHAIYGEHEAIFEIATGSISSELFPEGSELWSRNGWTLTEAS